MNRKNKSGIKILSLLAAGMIGVCCFTTACQPTPEEDIVAQKDSEKLIAQAVERPAQTAVPGGEKSAERNALKEKLEVPNRYRYTGEDQSGLITVDADADVVLPNAEAMPLQRVKMTGFSQEQTDKMVAALMRGQQIYEVRMGEPVFTKDQIETRLIELKRMLSQEDYTNLSREQIERDIEWYSSRLDWAPGSLDESGLTPSDGKLGPVDPANGLDFTFDVLDVMANLGERSMASLNITNNFEYKDVQMYFQSGWAWDGSPAAQELTISQERAETVAAGFFDEIGKRDYALYHARKDSAHLEHSVWNLEYIPAVSGFPVAPEKDGSGAIQGVEYTEPWSPERIIFTIDDNGIQGLQWISPCEGAEDLTQDANLLPFGEVTQRFEDSFFLLYTADSLLDKGVTYNMQFLIEEVSLSLMRISEKDSPDTGLLAPVWMFRGYQRADVDQTGELKTVQGSQGGIIMKINAVDGGIV